MTIIIFFHSPNVLILCEFSAMIKRNFYILIFLFSFVLQSFGCGGCGCNLGYGGNLSALSFQAPSLISIGYSFSRIFQRSLFNEGIYSLHTFNLAGQYTFKDNFQLSLSVPYVLGYYTPTANSGGSSLRSMGLGDPNVGVQYLNTVPLADDLSLFYAIKTAATLPLGSYDPNEDPFLQPGGGNWEVSISGQTELGYKKMSIRLAGSFYKYFYNPKTQIQTGNMFTGDVWLTRKFTKKDFMVYLFVGTNYLQTTTSYYRYQELFPITGSAFSLWNASSGFIAMYKQTGMFFQWLYPVKQSNLYIQSVFGNNISVRLFKLL